MAFIKGELGLISLSTEKTGYPIGPPKIVKGSTARNQPTIMLTEFIPRFPFGHMKYSEERNILKFCPFHLFPSLIRLPFPEERKPRYGDPYPSELGSILWSKWFFLHLNEVLKNPDMAPFLA